MLIRSGASTDIQNTPEAIWTYASDPANWTASNPEEHFGLVYDNAANRPEQGVTFTQRESVAGFRATLRGQILYADRPHVLVWTGLATYPLLGGIVAARIPEGGVLRLGLASTGTGSTLLSHDVYMDIPETPFGRALAWCFTHFFDGPRAVHRHTERELAFFKQHLNLPASSEEPARSPRRQQAALEDAGVPQ
jgi:hypothetical protein